MSYKNYSKTVLLSITILTLVFSISSSAAASPTSVATCQEISSSGSYVLSGDIVSDINSSCINVTASDVVLDGRESKLVSNSGKGKGVLVKGASNLTNVTVKDLVLEDWKRGIVYTDVEGGRVTGNSFDGGYSTGLDIGRYKEAHNITIENNYIDLATGTGISARGDDNDLIDNRVSGGVDGIDIVGTDNNVSENTVNGSFNAVKVSGPFNNIVNNVLIGDNSETGLELRGSADETTVSGNTVTGFDRSSEEGRSGFGVLLSRADDSNITANVLKDNGHGVWIYGGHDNRVEDNNVSFIEHGVTVKSNWTMEAYSRRNSIKSNNITGGDGYGVFLRRSENTRVEDNYIDLGGLGNGVYTYFAEDALIVSNEVRDTGSGIWLGGGSGNQVEDNNVVEAGVYGVSVHSSDNTIAGNRIVGGGSGLKSYAGSNNLYSNNTVRDAGKHGIAMFGATDNLFVNNTVNNTSESAYNSSEGSHNTVKQLRLFTVNVSFEGWNVSVDEAATRPDDGNYMNISRFVEVSGNSENSSIDLNVSYSDSDLGSVPEQTLGLYRHDGSWKPLEGGVNTAENYVYGSSSNFSVFAPLGANGVSSCMDITQPGRYVLTADIVDTSEDVCINISSSDVFFDGNGHTVDTHGDNGGSIGVLVHSGAGALSGVTVKNTVLSEWGEAVNFENVENSSIKSNQIRDSYDNGVILRSSDNNTVEDNQVTNQRDFDPTNYGVFLHSSGSNLIDNNTATGSSRDGIAVSVGSHHNTLRDNKAHDNYRSGLSVVSSDNTALEGNNASFNTLYGVRLVRTENTSLSETAAFDSGWSLLLDDTETGTVVKNFTFEPGATASLTGTGIKLKPASEPSTSGGNGNGIGYFLNITNESDDAWAYLNLSYNDSGLDEDRLSIYRYDNAWSKVSSSVDTDNDYVHGNVSSFSVFTAYEEPDSQPDNGGGGSSGGDSSSNGGNGGGSIGDTRAPIVDAGDDMTVYVGETANFEGSATDNSLTLDYTWAFGDSSTATGKTASHTYDQTGDYTVTLTVEDAAGNTGNDTLQVEVIERQNQTQSPEADFSFEPSPAQIDEEVSFEAAASDPDGGQITSYEWSIDGEPATGQTVTHSFGTPGDKQVELTVTDDEGETDTVSKTLTVEAPGSPTGRFIGSPGSMALGLLLLLAVLIGLKRSEIRDLMNR